jgi:hypothetical protein
VTIRWNFDPCVYPDEVEAMAMVGMVRDVEAGSGTVAPSDLHNAHLAYRRFGFPELEPVRVALAIAEGSLRRTPSVPQGDPSAPVPLSIGYGFNRPA